MTQRGRRDFLKSAGAVTAGALVTGNSLATEKTNLESKASPAADITRQTFAEAEKLTGVPYTDSERDMMTRYCRATDPGGETGSQSENKKRLSCAGNRFRPPLA